MARSLTIQRTTIPPSERDRYFARLRARSAHYKSRGCRFWVFEDVELRGAFVEFTEADDLKTLTDAHSSAPDAGAGPSRVYTIAELG